MVFEATARPRFSFAAAELRTDLAWRYTRPRDDGRRIAGRYGDHHERCHTEVDGRTSRTTGVVTGRSG
ncbi:MAG: hypothetical protein ACR2KP_13135 [Egibacteraceae bacterium]